MFSSLLKIASPSGRIGLLGFSTEESSFQQVDIVKKELTIVGSRLNNNKFQTVIKWFENEELEPEKLISHRFSFGDIEKAMATAEKDKNACKVIINFPDDEQQ